MPTPVSRTENMTRHMTNEEREARLEAEQSIRRDEVTLTCPKFVSDKAAKTFWEQTIERMEGIELLDDLDSEVLGLYCVQLSRRNELERLRKSAVRAYNKAVKTEDKDAADFLDQAASLAKTIATLERQILQYADKLGLTPSGRFRIARRRAENQIADPDEDLFG